MTFVTLSSSPRRAELREAYAMLQTLADLGTPGAREELQAVAELTRRLYPRKAIETTIEADADGKPVRRRRSKMISACDVMGPCDFCFERKIDPNTNGLLPLKGGECGTGHMRGRPDMPCIRCGGVGRRQCGTVQYRVVNGLCKWKERTPMYEPGPFHTFPRGPAFVHDRGFFGTRLIGPQGGPEKIIRRRAALDRVHLDAGEVSAALEGNARKFFKLSGLTSFPRNAKKMGSRRDKSNLKGRQDRRSKMEKRARRMQREFNRLPAQVTTQARGSGLVTRFDDRPAAPVQSGVERKTRLPSAAKLLAALGVDVKKLAIDLKALPPAIEFEVDLIAQARRLGDLPPDDRDAGEAITKRLTRKGPSSRRIASAMRKIDEYAAEFEMALP